MRRTHPTPINFVFLFPKLTDGQLSIYKIQIVYTLYSFTSPRIEKLKFSYFGTYEQSYVGLYFFDNPYERIIFQNVEAKCSSHTESIWLKYLFSQTSFMYVKPRIISERSRCLPTRSFLGKPRKRTRKQTRRSSMILGFSNINS